MLFRILQQMGQSSQQANILFWENRYNNRTIFLDVYTGNFEQEFICWLIVIFFTMNVMRCAIWHYLHNLKNVKNTHGEVLLLPKLQAFRLQP